MLLYDKIICLSIYYYRLLKQIYFIISTKIHYEKSHLVYLSTLMKNPLIMITCGRVVKNLPASAGDARDVGLIPGLGRSLEEEIVPHSSILAWKIPWTEGPGGLQSMGLERVRHNRESTNE